MNRHLIIAALATLTMTPVDLRPASAGDVVVAEHRSDTLGEIGMRVSRFKTVDTATGAVADLAVDEATGGVVDYAAVRAQAMQVQRARLGALDPAFEPTVRGALADTMLQADVLAIAGGPSGASLKKIVSKQGTRVLGVDGRLATIEASASFLAKLAQDPRIDSIARHDPKRTMSLAAATEMVEDKLFFAHALGAGTDLRIGILEPNACIRRTHQDFRFVTWEPRAGSATCSVPNGFHSTAVAGVLSAIRSVNGQWRYAGLFGGRLFEGESSTAVFDRNPNIINASETHTPIYAREMDAVVWDKRVLYITGSSNDDSGTTEATCYSYNALCIGGYGPMGTVGPNAFGDDLVATAAMWQNPSSGRERPDLVGPMGVTTAGWQLDNSYDGWGGTSFATPAVSGLAALLITNHRAKLDRQPTLMRALLVASAVSHTINDGDSTRLPIIGDGRDDRAGAGAPRGDVADKVVRDGAYHAKKVVRDTDFPNKRYTQTFGVNASAGQRVRIALSWDNCPVSPANYPNQDALIVDLDLTVRGPNVPFTTTLANVGAISGGLVAARNVAPAPAPMSAPAPTGGLKTAGLADVASTSTMTFAAKTVPVKMVPFVASNVSHVDNYETVEFVAPVTATYNVEITAPRWDLCPYDNSYSTNLAVAWAKQ